MAVDEQVSIVQIADPWFCTIEFSTSC